MLFSLLLITFVLIIAMVIAFAMYEQYVIIQIINAKGCVEEKVELPKVVKPRKIKIKREKKLTPEEEDAKKAAEERARKMAIVYENINAYNGTSAGQKEVK